MPAYRKKTYRKKRYTKRKPSTSYGTIALNALKGYALNKLKSRLGLNTESHWVDTVETNIGTGSTLSVMANPLVIPMGDTVNTRTGSSVRLTSMVVRCRIQANTAATTGTFVRVIFARIKDIRGTGFPAANILDDTQRITSHYNMGDRADAIGYTILFDKTFKIEINGQTGDIAQFMFKYKPTVHHLKWISTDTTGALTNLMSDQVRGFIMTSETGANTPNYWADYRVKFVDN